MKLEAFSLRDVKAESFGAPFFVPNENIAIRLLSKLVVDTRTEVGQYPLDFILYRVGHYDTDTGLLTPLSVELICTASSCLPKPSVPTPTPESFGGGYGRAAVPQEAPKAEPSESIVLAGAA